MGEGGSKLVCLFQPHFWETRQRMGSLLWVQSCCPWRVGSPNVLQKGNLETGLFPTSRVGPTGSLHVLTHWGAPKPTCHPRGRPILKWAGGPPGPGEELASPGPVGEQVCFRDSPGTSGCPAARAKPHDGGRFCSEWGAREWWEGLSLTCSFPPQTAFKLGALCL